MIVFSGGRFPQNVFLCNFPDPPDRLTSGGTWVCAVQSAAHQSCSVWIEPKDAARSSRQRSCFSPAAKLNVGIARIIVPRRCPHTRRIRNFAISLNSDEFDTYLYLRDAAGGVLASDDDGGEGTDSQIAFLNGDGGGPTDSRIPEAGPVCTTVQRSAREASQERHAVKIGRGSATEISQGVSALRTSVVFVLTVVFTG